MRPLVIVVLFSLVVCHVPSVIGFSCLYFVRVGVCVCVCCVVLFCMLVSHFPICVSVHAISRLNGHVVKKVAALTVLMQTSIIVLGCALLIQLF